MDGAKRITFEVEEIEFYVGQHVWSLEKTEILGIEVGTELIVVGHSPFDGVHRVCVRKIEGSKIFGALPRGLSFSPPRVHEWRRGDWARHKDGRKAFVCEAWHPHGVFGTQQLIVSFANEAITGISASEFTFIGHTEAPE